jgi:hypothetical protein
MVNNKDKDQGLKQEVIKELHPEEWVIQRTHIKEKHRTKSKKNNSEEQVVKTTW